MWSSRAVARSIVKMRLQSGRVRRHEAAQEEALSRPRSYRAALMPFWFIGLGLPGPCLVRPCEHPCPTRPWRSSAKAALRPRITSSRRSRAATAPSYRTSPAQKVDVLHKKLSLNGALCAKPVKREAEEDWGKEKWR